MIEVCDPITSAACIAQIAVGVLIPGAGGIAGAGAVPAAGTVAKAAAGTVANAAIGGLAGAIQDGIGTIAKDMVAWWINLPSPDLATDPVPRVLQEWLFPFTAGVAVVAVIIAGGRMALTRKAAPLIDVGSGLLTIAATAAAGTLLPALLLKAGDAYSTAVLNAATHGQFATRFTELIAFSTASGPGLTAILLIIGMIALVLAAVQAILLLFRQAAVIILAGVLPLAAAGTMTPKTKPWFPKTTGWMIALVFYKPCAATVYATGFLMIGQGTSAQDVLGGVAVLILSLVALPVLLRFFNWAPGQLEAAGGGGVLGAVIGGAAAIGALRGYGGGMSAADLARSMNPGYGGAPGGGPDSGGPAGRPGGGAGPDAAGPGAGPRAGQGRGPDPGGPAADGTAAAAAGPAPGAAAGTASGAAAAPAAGAATSSAAGASAAAGAGAAAAGAGAAGLVVLGAQVARDAGTRLAEGAAPPSDR